MPQLDKLSIVTQIFWLSLFFFSLYFFSLYFFAAITYKNLKLYSIMNKSCRQNTNFFSDHRFSAYSFYAHLIFCTLIKTAKVNESINTLEKTTILCDANFVFGDAQDDLYFYKLANFLTVNEKKYDEI